MPLWDLDFVSTYGIRRANARTTKNLYFRGMWRLRSGTIGSRIITISVMTSTMVRAFNRRTCHDGELIYSQTENGTHVVSTLEILLLNHDTVRGTSNRHRKCPRQCPNDNHHHRGTRNSNYCLDVVEDALDEDNDGAF